MENRINKCINLLKESELSEVEITKIINKLKEFNFFSAPASTKYHGAYNGGLFDHSYEVTKQLIDLTNKLELKWERNISPYIIGLFHDLCKCDTYFYDIETNKYKYSEDILLNGHGEKSVIIAQKILFLTEEEVLCIRWHMGAFNDKENWKILNNVIKEYPNVLYTHTADMIASQIKGI